MSVITFQALITQDQLSEGMTKQAGWNPVYRLALAMLTRSYDDLLDSIRQDEAAAEALLELLERLDDYMKWRQSETEMLEAAHARLALVLMQFAEEMEAAGQEGGK